MVMLDIAVVNVAAPTIRASLGFSPTGIQWVASIYIVAFAGLLMIGGRTADLYGSRRVFLLGLLAFTLASAASGLATSAGVLIAARCLQGCCAAVLSPATLTVIVTELSGKQRQRALGTWAAMSGVGGGLGVFLGGLLSQTLNWRWIFFINVPVGLVTLVIAWMVLRPDQRPLAKRPLDAGGAITLTLAMLAVVFATVQASTDGWLSAGTLTALGVAVVAALACWRVESRVAQWPVLPLRTLRNRVLIGANAVLFLLYTVVIAPWFLLSYYLQTVLGLTPLQAGLGFLPQALVIASSAQASPLVRRYLGYSAAMVIGPVLAAAGLLVMWWQAAYAGRAGYLTAVLIPLVLLGLAIGITLPAVTFVATADAGDGEAGLVSGLLNSSRQFGGAFGLGLIYTVGTRNAGPLGRAGAAPQPIPPGYATAALTGAFIALAAAALALALALRRRPA